MSESGPPHSTEESDLPSLAKYREKNLPEHQYQTQTAGPGKSGGTKQSG